MSDGKCIVKYLRLSLEDEDMLDESNSITNQRIVIGQYIASKNEFKNTEVLEFKDDGYSGTNFDRPGFQSMMELVRDGKVSTIIVKDLSRFGRNHIEVDTYLEQIFPFMNVRFIAINDNVDSMKYESGMPGIDVGFRNIINEHHSIDTSVKVKRTLIQRQKAGKYMGARAPYGYLKPDEDVTSLVINPETAPVVKMIFQKYLDGMNITQLARYLNEQKIMSPGQYKREVLKTGVKKTTEKYIWYPVTVRLILMTETYTGTTIGGKWKVASVGSNKHLKTKEEDWIVVEGMHEAIVSKDEFELAQAVIRGGEKNPKRNLRYYPLKGLVCCGNCKRALTRRKLRNEGGYFYQCTHSTHDRDTDCPVGERYSEAWIEDTAYKAIGQMLTLVEKRAVKEHEISKRRKSAITECADTIRDLQKQSEQLKAVKLRLYEKYTSGSITKAEYLKRKAETDAKMSENEEAIRQGHERMQELDSEHPCSDERLDAVLGEYQKGEGLTYELAHALISAIYVHGHDSIEIVWMFKDIFEDAEI